MGQARLSRDRDSKSFVGCYPSRDARAVFGRCLSNSPRSEDAAAAFFLLPPSCACPVLRSAPPFDVWSAGRRGAPVADHHLGRDLGHFPLPAGKKVKIGAQGLGGKYFRHLSQTRFV